MFLLNVKQVNNLNNASQLDVRYATTSDCHRSCSKLRPRRSTQSTPTVGGLLDAFKHIGCSDDVSCSDYDLSREIFHCSRRRLIHKQFQVSPEKEIQWFEVRGCGDQATSPQHPIHPQDM
ncbi:hypothetical protein TNCV_2775131 [Trichonephila clavipes]|nr:hypothetical protein TNCV_2775131 [Trichonephila clavipes]